MLLDTSGLLAMKLGSEPQNAKAVRLYRAARRRVTHGYVLAEWVPLAQVRGVPRAEALEFAADLIDSPDVKVVWVGETLHRQAVALLLARPDKAYSLCDAVSFVLMRQARMTDALSTDHHFEQEGFVRLLT